MSARAALRIPRRPLAPGRLPTAHVTAGPGDPLDPTAASTFWRPTRASAPARVNNTRVSRSLARRERRYLREIQSLTPAQPHAPVGARAHSSPRPKSAAPRQHQRTLATGDVGDPVRVRPGAFRELQLLGSSHPSSRGEPVEPPPGGTAPSTPTMTVTCTQPAVRHKTPAGAQRDATPFTKAGRSGITGSGPSGLLFLRLPLVRPGAYVTSRTGTTDHAVMTQQSRAASGG